MAEVLRDVHKKLSVLGHQAFFPVYQFFLLIFTCVVVKAVKNLPQKMTMYGIDKQECM